MGEDIDEPPVGVPDFLPESSWVQINQADDEKKRMGEDIDEPPVGVRDLLAESSWVQSKQRLARGYVISDEIRFSAGMTRSTVRIKQDRNWLPERTTLARRCWILDK
jgi:hypothetical protein